MFVQNFWCRYLCPYGAFLGIASLLSPLRITRTESTCIDCTKCAKACASALPVDKLVQICSAECTGCLECVAVCPAKDTLMTAAPYALKTRRTVPAWAIAAMVSVTFFTSVGYAKLSRHWDTKLPKQVFLQLVPVASEQRHPMLSRLK